MRYSQQRGDRGVAAGLLDHAVACVDQYHGQFRGRGAVHTAPVAQQHTLRDDRQPRLHPRGDEVHDLQQWDAIRLAPQTARAFEAGPDGLELLAIGFGEGGDAETLKDFWD